MLRKERACQVWGMRVSWSQMIGEWNKPWRVCSPVPKSSLSRAMCNFSEEAGFFFSSLVPRKPWREIRQRKRLRLTEQQTGNRTATGWYLSSFAGIMNFYGCTALSSRRLGEMNSWAVSHTCGEGGFPPSHQRRGFPLPTLRASEKGLFRKWMKFKQGTFL